MSKSKFKYDKTKYDNILDAPKNQLGVYINKFIDGLVCLSVLIVIFDSLSDFSFDYFKEIFLLDFFISTIFLLEYLYRIKRSKKRLNFIVNPLNVIDLLSFLPFFISLFIGNYTNLWVFKLLRIIRVLKLLKHIQTSLDFLVALKNYRKQIKVALFLFFTIVFIVSVIVFNLEKGVPNTKFTSVPISLWWAVVTATTVGYGDMYPATSFGKVFGSIIILLGPALMAMFSSTIILAFMDVAQVKREQKEHKNKKKCKRCSHKNPVKYHYCSKCGKHIHK